MKRCPQYFFKSNKEIREHHAYNAPNCVYVCVYACVVKQGEKYMEETINRGNL